MISDEKRAFKRTPHKFTVEYKRQGSSSPTGGKSVSENISLGGVYFASLERLDIGQLLECRIYMQGMQDEGSWTARVVRCENIGKGVVDTYGIAVEFVKAFGNSERTLKKVLNTHP